MHENPADDSVMSEKAQGTTGRGASAKAQGQMTSPQASAADAAIVDALRRGDEEAFTRLVDEHHEFLRRIARLYVSSPAIGDEVVQDTWLAVIQGLWAFEGRSSLKTWILRILINRSKTRALREGRTVPLSDFAVGDPEAPESPAGASHGDAADEMYGRMMLDRSAEAGHRIASLQDPGLSPEARLLTAESRVQLRAAIDALPASQRVVITMRDLEGCSSAEVCNALSLSMTNQRVILHRARSNVRRMLTTHLGEK